MLPLHQKEFPPNAEELAAALESSLRHVVSATARIVAIREDVYPSLEEIVINLNDLQISNPPVRPILASGPTLPAIIVNRLTIAGQRISTGNASLNLSLDAQNVVIHQGREENGNVVLVPRRAEHGRIALSMPEKELERAISQIVKIEAAKRSVTVEDVELKTRLITPRCMEAEIKAQVRKLFMAAVIRISGKLAIDEQLIARVSDLTCAGEGTFAALVCGILEPHLRKLNGKDFELMALPLGEVQVRDVRFAMDDEIRITAEFGAIREQIA